MDRGVIWHVQAFAWIAVVVGVAMVASNWEAAGQIVGGAGLVVAIATHFRPKPARPALPAAPEPPSEATGTP